MICLKYWLAPKSPEISDETLFEVDQAVMRILEWELGPFETWEMPLGVRDTVTKMETAGELPAKWVHENAGNGGHESIYKVDGAKKLLLWIFRSKSFCRNPWNRRFHHSWYVKSAEENLGPMREHRVYDMGDEVSVGIPFQKWIPWARSDRRNHTAISMAEKNLTRIQS